MPCIGNPLIGIKIRQAFLENRVLIKMFHTSLKNIDVTSQAPLNQGWNSKKNGF